MASVSAQLRSSCRPVRAIAVVALASSLTGCLTEALWDEPTPEPYLAVDFVVEPAVEMHGSVSLEEPGLVFRGEHGGPRLAMRRGAEASSLVELLRHEDLFEVVHVDVHVSSTWLRDLHVADRCEVAVEVALRPGALGSVVAAGGLLPEAEAVLAQVRRPGVFGDDARFVPSVFRDCVVGLAAIDVAAWAGFEGAVESYVFVGPDGRPAFGANGDRRGLHRTADGTLPLPERLASLASLDLLVRVRCGDGVVDARLAPDRIWLAACFEWRGRTGTHRSWWVPVGPAADAALADSGYPGQLLLTNQRFERFVRDTPGLELWQKIVLTPITLAVDLVMGTVLGPAWHAARRDRRPVDR